MQNSCFVPKKFVYLHRVSYGTQDIVGSDIPIHHLGQRSQIATRASAYNARAFQRLQWLVVSRECVGMSCAFMLKIYN